MNNVDEFVSHKFVILSHLYYVWILVCISENMRDVISDYSSLKNNESWVELGYL